MSMRQLNWNDASVDDFGGKKTALTIGVFDGLHRGHRALIEKITAKAPELLPLVVTFRKNPKHFSAKALEAHNMPHGTDSPLSHIDIISFDEKIALLAELGTALCVIIDFSAEFGTINGRAFLETLNRRLCPAYIALGDNFRCGYRRDTDAAAFKALAEPWGIEVEIVPPVMEGALPVSSSRIRAALAAGNTKEAALLLGRQIAR